MLTKHGLLCASTLALAGLSGCGEAEPGEPVARTAEALTVNHPDRLLFAQEFNAFAFENYTGIPHSEGPVAAGTLISTSAFAINDVSGLGHGLVTGGDLSLTHGTVHGSAQYGGSLGTSNVSMLGGSLQATEPGEPFSFDAARARLIARSATLASLTTEGRTNLTNWSVEFVGSDPVLNVFSVDANALDRSGMTISAPAGSTVVINVRGGTFVEMSSMGVSLQGGISADRILWNFPRVTQLLLSSLSFKGSALAPHAAVTFDNGNFQGTLVARSIQGSGEFHHSPFAGTLPPLCAECQPWNGRYQLELRDIEWKAYDRLTSAELQQALVDARRDNFIPINISGKMVAGSTPSVRYTLSVRENRDGRDWEVHFDRTSPQMQATWEELIARGYRLLDTEANYVPLPAPDNVRFAGIFIENREGLGFSSRRNIDQVAFDAFRTQSTNEGILTPTDIEIFEVNGEPRYSTIWQAKRGAADNVLVMHMTREVYQDEVDLRTADWTMIDYEAYSLNGQPRYSAIWQPRPAGTDQIVRTNRIDLTHKNFVRKYRDDGFRVLDNENHQLELTDLYSGVYVESDSRYRHAQKAAIDDELRRYLEGDGTTFSVGLPCTVDASDLDDVSVSLNDTMTVDGNVVRCSPPPMGVSLAVIQRGKVVYRRGVGWADRASGKVAHGGTAYQTASVAKTFAGTLAKVLQEDARYNLGLDRSVRVDVANPNPRFSPVTLPETHTFTYRNLLAHRGCVRHYTSNVFFNNPSAYYPNAMDAMQNYAGFASPDSYVSGCTVGSGGARYSTPAFTYAAAGWEAMTGRTTSELVEEHFTIGAELPTVKVSFATSPPAADYDRSVGYLTDLFSGSRCNTTNAVDRFCEYNLPDSSWKTFGGGMEGSAVDLARYGYKVLHGEIVADVEDLWVTGSDFGLAWSSGSLTRDSSGVITGGFVGHGGDAHGTTALLRIFPTRDLVIAVMANTRSSEPSSGNPRQSLGAQPALANWIRDLLP